MSSIALAEVEHYVVPELSEVWVNITGLSVKAARKVEAAVSALFPVESAELDYGLGDPEMGGAVWTVLHLSGAQ